QGYKAGGHDYLIKPFVKEDLIAKNENPVAI
ncbi:MAG: DNA-binding response OmpR family regulator, partial [Gammaproteobacteria bacterium]